MLLTVLPPPCVLRSGYFTSITRASIRSQERTFHLCATRWLCGFLFFSSFIFIFIDKASNNDWVARPKLLHSMGRFGWVLFLLVLFFFSEDEKKLSKKRVSPPPCCSPSRNPDYRSISFIPWSVIPWELKYSITWKHSLFWRMRSNGLLLQQVECKILSWISVSFY